MARKSTTKRQPQAMAGAAPKVVRIWDELHRERIRGMACLLVEHPAHVCGGDAGPGSPFVVQACHVKSRGSGGDDAFNLVPLCPWAHTLSANSLDVLKAVRFSKVWGVPVVQVGIALYDRSLADRGKATP